MYVDDLSPGLGLMEPGLLLGFLKLSPSPMKQNRISIGFGLISCLASLLIGGRCTTVIDLSSVNLLDVLSGFFINARLVRPWLNYRKRYTKVSQQLARVVVR